MFLHRISLTSIALLTLLPVWMNAQGNLVWARSMGGTTGDFGYANALDNAGNIILAGMFTGTIDADPGAGVVNLTSAGANDVFIIKLDNAGNLVWAGRIGGPSDDYGIRLTTDVSRNVFLVGRFTGTADFDPGAGVANQTSGGCEDPFVLKLNESGVYQWARRVGAGGCDEARGVVTDAAGNVYYSGNFTGTVDFDPGPGVVTKVCVATATDAFISKLDAAGNHVWTSHFDGTALSTSYAHNLTIDAAGNIYPASFFYGTVDFDPTAGVSSLASTAGNYDVAIVKLSGATGNLMMLRTYGGTPPEFNWGVAVDASGNIYTSGYYNAGTCDFDPGPGVFNITGTGTDGYICKVDASGNFLWARTFRSPANFTNCNSMKLDNSGNPVMVGYFNGTTDFDPGAGIFNLSAAGGQHDVFLVKLSSAGNFLCATRQGGTGVDFGIELAIDAWDNVWNVGQYNGTADFDPTAGTFNMTSVGAGDIFASVVTTCTSLLAVRLDAFDAIPQGDVVLLHWLTAEPLETAAWFEIERSTDAQEWEAIGRVMADAGKQGNAFDWVDPTPLNGLSHYRLVRHQQGQVDVSEAVAVMRTASEEVRVWPNPAASNLWVQVSTACEGRVLNLQGSEMLQVNLSEGENSLNVTALPAGMYLLQVQDGSGTQVVPFHVQH